MSQLISGVSRPSFSRALAEHVTPDILIWLGKAKDRIDPEWYDNLIASIPPKTEDFVSLVVLCIDFRDGPPDAFNIGTDLKTHCNWPVDSDLVTIFSDGIKFTRDRGHRQAITRWMMATGTRFHAKPGDKVTCEWNGKVHTGTVNSVDRLTATGSVNFDTDPKDQFYEIRAESLITASTSPQESLVA